MSRPRGVVLVDVLGAVLVIPPDALALRVVRDLLLVGLAARRILPLPVRSLDAIFETPTPEARVTPMTFSVTWSPPLAFAVLLWDWLDGAVLVGARPRRAVDRSSLFSG